ncbi:MAG: hypothetical protein KGI27_13570 [Thaumarchaeota archaeon]|nr:hypothetical protein [Nitrososphaerota archaeon]
MVNLIREALDPRVWSREGKLFYTIKQITKEGSGDIRGGQVGSKPHLDKLLSIKTFSDIHSIEAVA